MPCPLDPDLEKAGIRIDDFVRSKHVSCFLLTHAHYDHMKGLTEHFPVKRATRPKIYCTQVTANLAQLAVRGLSADYFVPMPYLQPFHLSGDLTVWAIPSYHCDGAAMFLFELHNRASNTSQPTQRILYTGDFRYHTEFRQETLLTEYMIHRMYYDDMFDEITEVYPTYEETFQELERVIANLQSDYARIYINASILGFEPLLRTYAEKYQCTFGLSPQLRGTVRGDQLQYLLDDKLDGTHEHPLTLAHRNQKHPNMQHPWIVPTCVYFLCQGESKRPKPPPPNVHYIRFCTHSNQTENNQMKQLVAPVHVNGCGERLSVENMSCNRN